MILFQLLYHQYGEPALLGAVSSVSHAGDDGRGVAEEEKKELPPGGLLCHHYVSQRRSSYSLLQVKYLTAGTHPSYPEFMYLFSVSDPGATL